MAESSNCVPTMPESLKYLLFSPFHKNYVDLCSIPLPCFIFLLDDHHLTLHYIYLFICLWLNLFTAIKVSLRKESVIFIVVLLVLEMCEVHRIVFSPPLSLCVNSTLPLGASFDNHITPRSSSPTLYIFFIL